MYSCDLAEGKCGSESLKYKVNKILTSSFLLSLGGHLEWQNISTQTVKCFVNLQEMLKTKLGVVEEFCFLEVLIYTFHTSGRNIGPLSILSLALPSGSSILSSFGQAALSHSIYWIRQY